MKSWMKILIYISLIFVVITIVKGEYFNIPEIQSYPYLILSFCCLAIGFVIDAYVWKLLLQKHQLKINLLPAYVAMSVPIFSKYIPGKIWSVVGRASYTAEIGGFPKSDTSAAAVFWQLLALLSGTFIGICSILPYLNVSKFKIWLLLLIALMLLLSIFIFNTKFIGFINRILSKITKKSIQFSTISVKENLKLLPVFCIMWMFFSIGFFFMIKSIDTSSISILAGCAFTLGSTLGILAIIFPGGLGVREGVLVMYLMSIQIDATTATTIAIFSRIWFLIAETLVFISGMILRRIYKI